MSSPADDPTLWLQLGPRPGLCRGCRHAELLASARSVFLRCGLSDQDLAFPRYPRLPVIACAGAAPRAGEPG